MRYAPLDTFWYIIAMLCIGFIEEILFRGYLLQLLLKRSIKVAVIVSSLTFGLGHIVNLVNGTELLPAFLQLIYALAAFSNELGQTMIYQIFVCVLISILSVGYTGFLWKKMDDSSLTH